MRKMIDPESEEGVRIQDEADEQVRRELGLTDVSLDDMSVDEFKKYYRAVARRCENAGVNPGDVLRNVVKDFVRMLREDGENEQAEWLEAMARRGEN